MFIKEIVPKYTDDVINVVIEISMNSSPVKYEIDKKSGAIFVDRFLHTSMMYPGNYGFIPNTLGNDGDPIDALVISNYPIISGAVISTRPVGVLLMEDESGFDEKIISVPIAKLDPTFSKVHDLCDICDILKKRIEHFFLHYKDLDQGKWVKILGWDNKKKAINLINNAIEKNS